MTVLTRWLYAASVTMLMSCGSSDDGAASEATLGVLLPLTGPFAELGVTAEGASNVAAQEINSTGVWGTDLTVLFRDSRFDVEASVRAAEELMDERGVGLLMVGDGAPVVQAVLDAAEERGVVVMTSLTGDIELDRGDAGLFFRTLPVRDVLPNWAGWWNEQLIAEGHRHILYVYNELAEGIIAFAADDFVAQCPDDSCTVELRSYPSASDPADLKVLVADLQSDMPDVLTVFGQEQEVLAVLQEAQSADYEGAIMVNDAFGYVGGDFVRLLQASTVARVRWVDAAANATADVATYAKRFEQLNSQWSSLGRAEFATYDAILVAALALERAKTNRGSEIPDALREVANPPGTRVGPFDYERAVQLIADGQDIDYDGLILLSFDSEGENTSNPQPELYGWDPDGRVVRRSSK